MKKNIKILNINEDRKASISHTAGKLLLIFFCLMLVFTIVSRAAASITVARVSIINPQRDRLLYTISGKGEIIPEEEKRFMVLHGYRIEDVYVKAGEQVSQETVLIRYSMEDLQKKYTTIENEIEKIKLLISQERLRQQPTESKPSASALLSLKQAEENLAMAMTNLEEAQKDYEISIHETKEKLLENKKKEYEAIVKEYETLIYSQEKQEKLSQRAVDDANTALEEAREAKVQIEVLIDNYKDAVLSKDRINIYKAQEAIFEAFYGSGAFYEEHKEAIFQSALDIIDDEYYLWYLQNNILHCEELLSNINDEMQNVQSSIDSLVNTERTVDRLNERYKNTAENLLGYLVEYERQIDIIENSIGVLESGRLRKLRKDDKQLKKYLLDLKKSIEDGVDYKTQWTTVYVFILGDKHKVIEKDIENNTLNLTRAKEDYDLLKEEHEIARNNLQTKLNELKIIISSIEDGTYDFQEDLELKKQAVKAANEAVRLAKQAVEIHKLPDDKADDANSKQISELILQSYNIDLREKEKELDELRELMECSGKVLSPYDGVVTYVGVEAGRATTGDEMIKLGIGDYVFKATFDREDAVNVEVGSKVNITMAGKKSGIESEVEEITINEEGISELRARMPQKDYYLGEKAEYKISTQSEQFNLCIPIQALREDNYGYYVLVPLEQEDILGTQLIAERISVNILDKGNSMVAVEGALSHKSQVIIDSNKYINAGYRVRID